jgi:hypothetical protein
MITKCQGSFIARAVPYNNLRRFQYINCVYHPRDNLSAYRKELASKNKWWLRERVVDIDGCRSMLQRFGSSRYLCNAREFELDGSVKAMKHFLEILADRCHRRARRTFEANAILPFDSSTPPSYVPHSSDRRGLV